MSEQTTLDTSPEPAPKPARKLTTPKPNPRTVQPAPPTEAPSVPPPLQLGDVQERLRAEGILIPLPTPWERLRAPFPPEQIGKLPRVPKKMKDDQRSDCSICGGYHVQGPGVVHLDYVGHAAVTSRLLEVDPLYDWEPVAKDEHGRPIFEMEEDDKVGLWIRLTINGKARLGFGSVPAGTTDAEKQLIGDALRNAAMRFGVAVDLWMKSGEEKDITDNAGGAGGASKQYPERMCAECGVIFQQTKRPKASIYDTARLGVKVGDPIILCPDCGKWTPVMDVPGKTNGEQPAAPGKAQMVSEEAAAVNARRHLGLPPTPKTTAEVKELLDSEDPGAGMPAHVPAAERAQAPGAKEKAKFAPGHEMRRTSEGASCECGLEFTDPTAAKGHYEATLAAAKPDDLPF